MNKLNALNNEYKQIIQELENKLNNEKISLDEYKKRLNTSNDTYEKEIQKLKEELKKSKEYINRDKKDEFRGQKGSGTFTSQNKFVKLLTLLAQLLTKNNSKKFKDDINQILKELYHSKQITKQVYNILNKSILYKNDS